MYSRAAPSWPSSSIGDRPMHNLPSVMWPVCRKWCSWRAATRWRAEAWTGIRSHARTWLATGQLVMHIEGVEDLVISPRIWRSDSFYVMADMLADGIGWGILPRNIAQTPDIEPRIVAIDCPELRLPPLAVRMLSLQGAKLDGTALWIQQRLAALLIQGD